MHAHTVETSSCLVLHNLLLTWTVDVLALPDLAVLPLALLPSPGRRRVGAGSLPGPDPAAAGHRAGGPVAPVRPGAIHGVRVGAGREGVGAGGRPLAVPPAGHLVDVGEGVGRGVEERAALGATVLQMGAIPAKLLAFLSRKWVI